jgi:hypothetical protein
VSLPKQGSNQVGETNVKQTKKTVEGAKPEKSCIYDGGCVENPIVGKGKIPIGRDCGENEKKENSQNKIICFKGDNGLFGFKDERGKIIIPCVWKCVSPYSEGMAAVENEAGLWGFIDKTGKNVIPCVWKKSKHFRNGLAAVSNDAVLWGFIDKTGKIILPIKWKIKNHIDGYWLSKYVEVTDENDIEYQIINEKGELRKKSTTESVAPQKSITTLSTDSNEKKKKWKFISNYHEGFARVQDETGKWGFIDGKNNIISPCIWTEAGSFHEGLAYVRGETGLYGYIDKMGKQVVPLQWNKAHDFSCKRARVKNSMGKYGFIDTSGELVIPCKYLYADDFSFKGEAEVTTNWFECIIDTDGKIQRNAEYWAQFIHWLTLGLSICIGICSILSLLLFFVNGHSSFLEIFLWSSIISWILFVLFILWQPK